MAGRIEHQRCSRTDRVQKNHRILGKNTIFNEHPVCNVIDKVVKVENQQHGNHAAGMTDLNENGKEGS